MLTTSDNLEKFITIGKIVNFFGIKGEAKVGFNNENLLKNAKTVYMNDDSSKCALNIKSVRFHKNFAIVKFSGIDDINDVVKFKGQRLFILKNEAKKSFDKNEYLINDLIKCIVYNENNEKLGEVVSVSSNSAQDILNIKNLVGKIDLVPFVNEFFPLVDVENKKIIMKPIEGLLS